MASKNNAYRLIRDTVPEVGQRADDPIVAPAGILSGHRDDQPDDLLLDRRPARVATVFRAVELLGDQSAIPGEDSVGFGYPSNLAESVAAQPFADFSRVDLSSSERRSRLGRWARSLRFSVAKYSFWRSSGWFTMPVTYAKSRSHLLSFIPTVHHRKSRNSGCFEYFDPTRSWSGFVLFCPSEQRAPESQPSLSIGRGRRAMPSYLSAINLRCRVSKVSRVTKRLNVLQHTATQRRPGRTKCLLFRHGQPAYRSTTRSQPGQPACRMATICSE